MQSQAPIHFSIWVWNPLTYVAGKGKIRCPPRNTSKILFRLCILWLVKQAYVITLTGIFQSMASSVEARTLLRPHMTINCPIGFPDPSSNNDSPRANAVFLTGPIPSPPPINNTAGKCGSISSSTLKSSFSQEKCKNKQNQSSVQQRPNRKHKKKHFTFVQ